MKQLRGQLVRWWETTLESWLLYVFAFTFSLCLIFGIEFLQQDFKSNIHGIFMGVSQQTTIPLLVGVSKVWVLPVGEIENVS